MPKLSVGRKRANTPLPTDSAESDTLTSGEEEVILRSPPRSKKKTAERAAIAVEKVLVQVPEKVTSGKSGVSGSEGASESERKGKKTGGKLGPAGRHLDQFRRKLDASREGVRAIGGSAEHKKGQYMGRFKSVRAAFSEAVIDMDGISKSAAKDLLGYSLEFEELFVEMVAEIAHLKGQLEATHKLRENVPRRMTGAAPAGAVMMPAPQAPAPVLPASPMPKPVETWSVVVRGKTPTTSKEVISKVVKEVGPSMGVRVHEVRPLKDGGAIIRTPSVAERDNLAKNARFSEVGLDVSVRRKLGPRVVVQGVHTGISPDEFMGELFRLNLKEFSPGCLQKDVRMVSRPWKISPDGATNVVLEGTDMLMSALLEAGRCYIKWFSFRVRPDRLTPGCFRCMGFDHRVAECRAKKDVCRRCGQEGHRSTGCGNAPHCRNCAFKGKPAGHLMMSTVCPIYGAIVARAQARH